MSEAELHLLRARLHGGILNRAKRGELKMPLPLGLVYDPLDRVVLDPDAQVQQCAVERHRPSAGANPARQLSLQPVAIGAGDGGNDIA